MSRHHGVLCLLVVGLTLSSAAQQEQPLRPQPRPPVFRAGAHYVRVDAYPTGKDGKIIEGLTKDDFEIYEDGKLQAIDNFEYLKFETWTPDGERKNPRTLQDAYDLAADPSWRVFVIVIDRGAYGMAGQHYLRGPLHQFVDRNLGPRDLFGLLTTENEWTDLTLGQTTTAANAVIDRRDWQMGTDTFDERWALYYECGLTGMIPVATLDDKYTLLEGLVRLLSLIRQEKKSIVFVSNGLAAPPLSRNSSAQATGGAPRIPGVPVGPAGYPGLHGPRVSPPTGGGTPRGPTSSGDRVVTQPRAASCAGERMRLANIDFSQRFRDLLREARGGNVAFYPVSPGGLQTIPFDSRGRLDMAGYHRQRDATDSLRTLADETDGLAIVNTNDLAGGMRRIANDMQAYYVLGYYTQNTNWDGRLRNIKVKLKRKRPSTTLGAGNTIRARRQYRAPTAEEIAGLSTPSPAARIAAASAPPPDVQRALAVLERNVPAPDEPALALLVAPQAYRSTLRSTLSPAGTPNFTREERLRVHWQVRQPLERRSARVLDRTGRPLPIEVPLRDGDVPETLVVELPLASFARGDYVLELAVRSGSIDERSLLAFRIQ
jgi:VWFA-related protein